ncbi:MAG: hypothetical protein JW871_07590 [Endomicrobiales bacterium]|nr:hypothetical protein [Endomicrobiales bacterium]
MEIDEYSFGFIKVNGKSYNRDIIIFPDKVINSWWRKEGHSLNIDDLKIVIAYKPEFLIIGKGASGVMDVPYSTKKKLEDLNIKIIDRSTDEAVKIFNDYLSKGKKVVGAFHLTC